MTEEREKLLVVVVSALLRTRTSFIERIKRKQLKAHRAWAESIASVRCLNTWKVILQQLNFQGVLQAW